MRQWKALALSESAAMRSTRRSSAGACRCSAQAAWAGLWLVFIGWFLYSAALMSYRQLLTRESLEGVPVSRVMTPAERLRTLAPQADAYEALSLMGRASA